ncbi:MAG: flavodoxin family protein [Tissierellia bacterium]|nr:flavodoxin family protein [Tissierellia bacterium]
MKGIILYASNTGNTKRFAEKLYEVLNECYDMTLERRSKDINMEDYDFALVGSWIEQGHLEKKTSELIESTKQQNLGIFATMGTDPETPHGEEVKKALEEQLKDKNALGVQIRRGKVAQKLIERLDKIPENIVPKEFKEQMYEASIHSKVASGEELQESAEFFKEKIGKIQ